MCVANLDGRLGYGPFAGIATDMWQKGVFDHVGGCTKRRKNSKP